MIHIFFHVVNNKVGSHKKQIYKKNLNKYEIIFLIRNMNAEIFFFLGGSMYISYIYIYIYVCTYVYVYTYIHMHIHTHKYIHIYLNLIHYEKKNIFDCIFLLKG